MSVDSRKLMAEIQEDVRRRRATGELPADLERELDIVFARYAPVGAIGGDFGQVLAKVEESTLIDTIAPTESSRPVVPYFKLVVRKATGWYMRYVAQQVSGVVQALARALRLLGDRVDALEASAPGTLPEAVSLRRSEDLSAWHGPVAEALTGTSGRVLHGECGQGDLVAHLVAAGLDAYGVEPSDDVALDAAARDLDVRADDVAAHLRLLERGTLGGLVLSGCVDRAPLGSQVELVDLAAAAVASRGTLVVVGTDPGAWGRSRSALEADLAPGRPLHPETWAALLSARGFGSVTTQLGASERALQPVPPSEPGADVMNANLAVLNEVLFRPATYAVFATRT